MANDLSYSITNQDTNDFVHVSETSSTLAERVSVTTDKNDTNDGRTGTILFVQSETNARRTVTFYQNPAGATMYAYTVRNESTEIPAEIMNRVALSFYSSEKNESFSQRFYNNVISFNRYYDTSYDITFTGATIHYPDINSDEVVFQGNQDEEKLESVEKIIEITDWNVTGNGDTPIAGNEEKKWNFEASSGTGEADLDLVTYYTTGDDFYDVKLKDGKIIITCRGDNTSGGDYNGNLIVTYDDTTFTIPIKQLEDDEFRIYTSFYLVSSDFDIKPDGNQSVSSSFQLTSVCYTATYGGRYKVSEDSYITKRNDNFYTITVCNDASSSSLSSTFGDNLKFYAVNGDFDENKGIFKDNSSRMLYFNDAAYDMTNTLGGYVVDNGELLKEYMTSEENIEKYGKYVDLASFSYTSNEDTITFTKNAITPDEYTLISIYNVNASFYKLDGTFIESTSLPNGGTYVVNGDYGTHISVQLTSYDDESSDPTIIIVTPSDGIVENLPFLQSSTSFAKNFEIHFASEGVSYTCENIPKGGEREVVAGADNYSGIKSVEPTNDTKTFFNNYLTSDYASTYGVNITDYDNGVFSISLAKQEVDNIPGDTLTYVVTATDGTTLNITISLSEVTTVTCDPITASVDDVVTVTLVKTGYEAHFLNHYLGADNYTELGDYIQAGYVCPNLVSYGRSDYKYSTGTYDDSTNSWIYKTFYNEKTTETSARYSDITQWNSCQKTSVDPSYVRIGRDWRLPLYDDLDCLSQLTWTLVEENDVYYWSASSNENATIDKPLKLRPSGTIWCNDGTDEVIEDQMVHMLFLEMSTKRSEQLNYPSEGYDNISPRSFVVSPQPDDTFESGIIGTATITIGTGRLNGRQVLPVYDPWKTIVEFRIVDTNADEDGITLHTFVVEFTIQDTRESLAYSDTNFILDEFSYTLSNGATRGPYTFSENNGVLSCLGHVPSGSVVTAYSDDFTYTKEDDNYIYVYVEEEFDTFGYTVVSPYDNITIEYLDLSGNSIENTTHLLNANESYTLQGSYGDELQVKVTSNPSSTTEFTLNPESWVDGIFSSSQTNYTQIYSISASQTTYIDSCRNVTRNSTQYVERTSTTNYADVDSITLDASCQEFVDNYLDTSAAINSDDYKSIKINAARKTSSNPEGDVIYNVSVTPEYCDTQQVIIHVEAVEEVKTKELVYYSIKDLYGRGDSQNRTLQLYLYKASDKSEVELSSVNFYCSADAEFESHAVEFLIDSQVDNGQVIIGEADQGAITAYTISDSETVQEDDNYIYQYDGIITIDESDIPYSARTISVYHQNFNLDTKIATITLYVYGPVSTATIYVTGSQSGINIEESFGVDFDMIIYDSRVAQNGKTYKVYSNLTFQSDVTFDSAPFITARITS